jgi:uncharacterized protein YrrD
MDNKQLIRLLITAFKADGAEVEELQHGYRINGVMDIMKSKLTVYDINNHKYHRCIEFSELEPIITDILMNNKKREFKKTATGNISYKEFKHNLKKL